MGGQACVFYGAAQFSKDVDFLVLADEENFAGLLAAMAICPRSESRSMPKSAPFRK
jgi:hypothetical protein